jgi:hypothetical protein
MRERSLQLTFVRGRPIGAYIYLPRKERAAITRTVERSHGLIVDYSGDGGPVGIEIITFDTELPDRVNQLLTEMGLEPLSPEEQRALRVA